MMTDEIENPHRQMLERKLATILSADVAGYSRLMAEDEEKTLQTFQSYTEVFRSIVELHRGRVFNTAGDALLAEFGSAVEAVRCATEIQAALRTRNDQLPPARQVKFRIGVNLGDVMVHGTDLLGDGVNVAARLQAAAEPGGVCISGSVYDQIQSKLSLSFKSLGEQSFKNIPQPVRTFSITGSDEHGALPSPKSVRRSGAATGGGAFKWVIAAIIVLAVAGGGYWAYSESQRSQAEQTRLLAEAEAAKQDAARHEAQLLAEKQAAEAALHRAEADREAAENARRDAQNAAEREAAAEKIHAAQAEQQRLEAEKRTAEIARQQAEADRKRAEDEARRLVQEQRKKEEEASRVAALQPPRQAPPPAAPNPVAPATSVPAQGSIAPGSDGFYAGPICYGPGLNDGPRCFRGQAHVTQGKIAGQWPARDPGVTMKLERSISQSGDVNIEMHTETIDGGGRMIRIALSGTLHDGHIDATGSFVGSGRTANVTLQRQSQ